MTPKQHRSRANKENTPKI